MTRTEDHVSNILTYLTRGHSTATVFNIKFLIPVSSLIVVDFPFPTLSITLSHFNEKPQTLISYNISYGRSHFVVMWPLINWFSISANMSAKTKSHRSKKHCQLQCICVACQRIFIVFLFLLFFEPIGIVYTWLFTTFYCNYNE